MTKQDWDVPLSVQASLWLGAFAAVFLVAGLGAWAASANIAGAVITEGRIEGERNRHVIQHPDGGVVDVVEVREGQSVRAGQVLIRLDGSRTSAELALVEHQLAETVAQRLRLEAESDGTEEMRLADYPKAFIHGQTFKAAMRAQRQLLEVRRRTEDQFSAQFLSRRAQIKTQLSGLAVQKQANADQMVLISAELERQTELVERGLGPAHLVLSLKREQARLSGELGELDGQLARVREQAVIAEREHTQWHAARDQETAEALLEHGLREIDLRTRWEFLQKRLAGLEIVAPVSGVVHGLQIQTERAVLPPAAVAMELVLEDQPLIVVAQLMARHIDHVSIGQPAFLRFPSHDQHHAPKLKGQIINL